MSDLSFTRQDTVADEYGNLHRLASELARGGQGVVYRTADADLAVKQPLAANGEADRDADLRQRFRNVRCLPLPPGIPVSLPLATLRDEPGYVMSLLDEMEPFGAFDLTAAARERLSTAPVPSWLAAVKDRDTALPLVHYAGSGSTKRRLLALAKVAAILARLHAAGLVYGDISPNNCFKTAEDPDEVWLIDADNLRFERVRGGNSVYTPRYGAPEIVQGTDQSRPRTDCWAFAVMAFETLSLVHPFIGRQVLEPDDEGGWDSDPDPAAGGASADLDEQAYAGYLPYVDDRDDDSNRALSGLPRELVLTPQLARLFQETFGPGRTRPWRRPSMAFWALELTRAHDQSVECLGCAMTYLDDHAECPYCTAPRPARVVVATDRWRLLLQPYRPGPDGLIPRSPEVALPHRLFHPFSLRENGRTEYEADFANIQGGRPSHVRGTRRLPPSLSFEFLQEGQ
jgi:Protein kinase domain